MPVFPKPAFPFTYNVSDEITRLRAHKKSRGIPDKTASRLLTATWNIANFGAQARRDQDRKLIAEIIGWFDMTAVQECRENFADLFDVLKKLPPGYRVLMSDASGNDERLAFIYDGKKLILQEEVGEVTFSPSRYKDIKLPGSDAIFQGHDRTPYLASFLFGKTSFTFVNAHLYFGDESAKSMSRRSLEALAIAKWADERKRSAYSFTRELALYGDFNMPKRKQGDPIFDAMTKFGLELPEHSTKIASSISSDAEYDQVAFFPQTTKDCFTGLKGVFDYDGVVFPALWKNGANKNNFKAYLRYYLSDHRPLWAQLKGV